MLKKFRDKITYYSKLQKHAIKLHKFNVLIALNILLSIITNLKENNLFKVYFIYFYINSFIHILL